MASVLSYLNPFNYHFDAGSKKPKQMQNLGGGNQSNSPYQLPEGFTSKAPEGNWFSGTPAGQQLFPTMNPAQAELQQGAIQQLMQLLNQSQQPQEKQDIYSGFQPIEERAREQFQSRTIPGLAERFTSMGGQERGSSAFTGALGQAGSDLESQLAALRTEYGKGQQELGLKNKALDQNKMQGLMQLLSGISQRSPWESIYHQRQPGAFETTGSSALQVLTSLLPFLV